MTGDHHGRASDGITLLVRALDVILGKHKSVQQRGQERPVGG